ATSAPFTPTSSLPAVAPTGLGWAPTVTGTAPPTQANTGIRVSWTPLPTDEASTGGLPITGYNVTITPDQPGTTPQTKFFGGPDTSSGEFTNVAQLTTGGTGYRTYTVTVVA